MLKNELNFEQYVALHRWENQRRKLVCMKDTWANQSRFPFFWTEHGASVNVMPRQSGKTTLIQYVKENVPASDDYVVVWGPWVHSHQGHRVQWRFNMREGSAVKLPDLQGCATSNAHLLVDEYQLLTDLPAHGAESYLSFLLDRDWKSVFMVGSMM